MSEIMGADTISKNGRSLKSHTSKGNFLTLRILLFLFFTVIGVCTVNNVKAQKFDCKKDKLDYSTVRISPDPSNLTFGERCDISIFNSKGKKVSEKNFKLTSKNRNMRSSGLSFVIDNKTTGDPWQYLDGKLVEEEGTITIEHNDCNVTYDFTFQIQQAYEFANSIACNGERREFAVARYKNALGKDLFVVMDVTRNKLYLLESPVSIDASGLKGRTGVAGSAGKSGSAGTKSSPDGAAGGSGGDGGDGGDGNPGGDITVYLPKSIQGISVNIAGGDGGDGGAGGAGGKGGSGFEVKTDKKGFLGMPIYEKVGKDGTAGNDGRPGRDGKRGKDGSLTKVQDDNIKKYFENINQVNFNIDDIEEN